MAALVTCDFIRARHNLHFTGPTGSGKSWLACALGQQACRQGLSVRYERVPRLLENLRLARGDGSLGKKLQYLAKIELLILDDFGLKPLTATEKHDLLELIEDRHALRSTLVTSQLPIKPGTSTWASPPWRMRCWIASYTTRIAWSCAGPVCESRIVNLTPRVRWLNNNPTGVRGLAAKRSPWSEIAFTLERNRVHLEAKSLLTIKRKYRSS
jgi:hypothetical protein